jgi:MFS family permease
MIRELISQLGWNQAVQATAGLTAGTALLSAICAQPNPKHPLNKGDSNKWLSVRRWVDPPAFKNATFNWFCAAIALMFFGFYAVFFHLEEWALHHGLGRSNVRGDDAKPPVFYYLSVMNGASTIGRLSSGYLSDHYGALNVHFIVMLVSSLLLLLLWTFATNVGAAFAFVVIFGAFSGAVIGMPPATIANIIHHAHDTDHSRMGHWTGMMYTIAAPFSLTGPVIAGHLISEYNDNFLTVQMWSGICLFLSSLCIGAAIYCMRYQDQKESGLPRVRTFASRVFDVENGSIFRSGATTAGNSRPDTRDVSDNEKDSDKE